MLKRLLTSLVGIIIACSIIIMGKQAICIAITVLGIIGLLEFYYAMKNKCNPLIKTGVVFGAVYLLFIEKFIMFNEKFIIFNENFAILFIIMMLVIFGVIIAKHKEHNIIDGAVTIMGFLYVCVLLSFIYLVRDLPGGDIYVWTIFFIAWGSDTGAYLLGCAIGKIKLCPEISPKKTIAGALGGVLFGVILLMIYMGILIKFFNININNYAVIAVVLGSIGSIASQIGDLAASVIKRYTGIKDYGDTLPGHGGVLDRFDSVLFVAPVVYYGILMMM